MKERGGDRRERNQHDERDQEKWDRLEMERRERRGHQQRDGRGWSFENNNNNALCLMPCAYL